MDASKIGSGEALDVDTVVDEIEEAGLGFTSANQPQSNGLNRTGSITFYARNSDAGNSADVVM